MITTIETAIATIRQGAIDMRTSTVITGASSGLGKCIAREMSVNSRDDGSGIINWSLDTGVDIRSKASIEKAVANLGDVKIDILINCASINGINFLPDVTEEEFDNIVNTNIKGHFLTTQALAEKLRGGTMLSICSNASHIPMTSSLAYNLSKAAQVMMVKQLSRELVKTHDITVFGISPNKLKNTGMSAYIDHKVQELRGWTAEEARNYQLQSLPAGTETDPETLAEFISFLLSSKERHRYFAGCIIPYGL